MILEDFVMLGKTVPEPNTDGRVFVCSAGISTELGSLIRIYPLARTNAPHRWRTYRVPVERNPKDHRAESWKIKAPRGLEHHHQINSYFEETGTIHETHRAELLRRYVVGSIDEANERRLSLAIIHPTTAELYFKFNPDSPDSPHLALFELEESKAIEVGAKRFLHMPYIKFQDDAGAHNLQLRDWGCYELMRKQGYDYARANMAAALHLDESASLFVGNMNHHRNTWLVISVLKGLRDEPTLFDEEAR